MVFEDGVPLYGLIYLRIRRVRFAGSNRPWSWDRRRRGLQAGGDRRVPAWWRDRLLRWRFVDVGEADPLHRIKVI